MIPDAYLSLLRQRLATSYDVEGPRRLGGLLYPLYARSRVVVGKHILHRSLTYERIEVNEHVLCRLLSEPATQEEVGSFVEDLRGLVAELVQPSGEHMSSALTGVLIAERGFTSDAAKKVVRSGFTKSFSFGLRGWCFLRLLGVDLNTGQLLANRRGKEVVKAYSLS